MGTSKKKLILVVIIVLCFALAAAITYHQRSFYKSASSEGGLKSLKRGELIWVKCQNADCGAEYQTDKKDYFEYLEAHPPATSVYLAMLTDPNATLGLPVLCRECGKEKAYRAEKCEKCGLTFLRGSVRHDFADRCPGCSHSKTERLRKEAQDSE